MKNLQIKIKLKILKKLSFFILAFYFLSTLFFILPVNAKKHNTKKNNLNKKKIYKSKIYQKKQIDYKKKIIKENLRDIKLKQKSVATELIQNQQQLEKTKKKLDIVQNHFVKVSLEKDKTTHKVVKTQTKLKNQRVVLAKRIVEIYKYGEVGIWEVLLQSENFWDFLNRLRFLRYILNSDVRLVSDVKKTKEVLEKQELLLAKKQKQVAAEKTNVEKTKTILHKTLKNNNELKNKLIQSRAAYEQMLAQLEQTSKEIENWIQKYITSQKKYTYYNYKWTGKWLKPVPGKITSGFGYRTHPIYKIRKMHTGVDFAAAYGTPVHVAASGIVIYAGWWGGYGKVVIINHGNGITTLYGHNAKIAVSVGQKVKAGQIISYTDSTGLSTGNHLHFEVRKNGIPVNPY